MAATQRPQIKVRQKDYYGGDLWVELDDHDGLGDSVTIVWRTWGHYGGVEISLEPGEARQLAQALVTIADSLP